MCTEAGDRVGEEGDTVTEAEVEEEELDMELKVGGEDSGALSLALSLGRGLRAQPTLPPHRFSQPARCTVQVPPNAQPVGLL